MTGISLHMQWPLTSQLHDIAHKSFNRISREDFYFIIITCTTFMYSIARMCVWVPVHIGLLYIVIRGQAQKRFFEECSLK
jgi:hypothetical protein